MQTLAPPLSAPQSSRKDAARAQAEQKLVGLMKGIAQGNQDALASFYDQTQRLVFGLALRILNDRGIAEEVTTDVYMQVWRLPLFESYRKQLASKISDLKNVSSGGLGGAIIAALYLDEFVGVTPLATAAGSSVVTPPPPVKKPIWIHLDHMAYNQVNSFAGAQAAAVHTDDSAKGVLHVHAHMLHTQASKPGRPEGGEAQGMRALFALLVERYGKPAHYPL